MKILRNSTRKETHVSWRVISTYQVEAILEKYLNKNFAKISKSLAILEAKHKRISDARELRKLAERKAQTDRLTLETKIPKNEDPDTHESIEIILREPDSNTDELILDFETPKCYELDVHFSLSEQPFEAHDYVDQLQPKNQQEEVSETFTKYQKKKNKEEDQNNGC